jgi:ATP-dependent RNA helicase DHX37/DHR1
LDGKNDGYSIDDAANTLVLPSLKRATKIISKDKTITRILSKKQRKKLEKVVEQKKKKENVSTTIENIRHIKSLNVFISASISVCSLSVMPTASRRVETIHQH